MKQKQGDPGKPIEEEKKYDNSAAIKAAELRDCTVQALLPTKPKRTIPCCDCGDFGCRVGPFHDIEIED